MFVKKLKYDNFRNLSKGEILPDKEINVIFGDNAQGKTNLSEAVWLFTGQKSFRGNKDSQLVNKDNILQAAKLSMNFHSANRDQSAEIEIIKKRKAVLNESELKSVSELSAAFSAVIFSPLEMQLINDGPAIRRKFLDNAISVIRPKYEKVLFSYLRAVQQRNAILKDVCFHSELSFMLDSFEDRIAKNGAYIISQRQKYIEAVMKYLPEIYEGISSNKEKLKVAYKMSAEVLQNNDLEQTLRQRLFESRKEDMISSVTGVGPHRDDIEFFINDDSVKIYGSQGQRRSAVLSLKLSEAEILKNNCNDRPVMILDDVMSELDKTRQNYILNHIKGWQVFITCCDPTAIDRLISGKCFRVENGQVTEQ